MTENLNNWDNFSVWKPPPRGRIHVLGKAAWIISMISIVFLAALLILALFMQAGVWILRRTYPQRGVWIEVAGARLNVADLGQRDASTPPLCWFTARAPILKRCASRFVKDTATPLLACDLGLANAVDLVTVKGAIIEQVPRYREISVPTTVISGGADNTFARRRGCRTPCEADRGFTLSVTWCNRPHRNW